MNKRKKCQNKREKEREREKMIDF
jgi:colicin import membrane protein